MRTYEKVRTFWTLGAPYALAGMTLMACSKGDSVNNQVTNAGTQVTTCGNLDMAQATQLATTRLEHLGTVGLAALAGLENSRAAARLLSFGNANVIDPFVDDAQSNLHDSLDKLLNEQLIASNLESTETSGVVFVLKPGTVCKTSSAPIATIGVGVGGASGTGGAPGTGGSSAVTLDPDCVSEQTAHPIRIRISRIACDQGDNIAVEVTRDNPGQRLLLAELYAEHAELELDLGAFLLGSYSTTTSSIQQPSGTYVTQTTKKPLVSAATGVLRSSLTLTGSAQASGNVSVAQAIDVTVADDSAARFRLAAGTSVATIAADGAAKTIQLTSQLGSVDLRTQFKYFISDFFGLSTTASADTQQPVDLHLAGLRGSLNFDGTKDTITGDGLDLGGSPATATQAGVALLSVNATNAAQGTIAGTLTGHADDSLGITLANGLSVNIQYGLQSVLSLIENPANYLASDTLKVNAAAGSSMTLWSESTTNDLVVTYSQTGQLLRVDSGNLTFSSLVWPNDTVTTSSNQCLTRTPKSQSGHNDLLDDFTVGACTQ